MSTFSLAEFTVSLIGMVGTVGAAIAASKSALIAEENTKISREMLQKQNQEKIESIKPIFIIKEKDFEILFDKEKNDEYKTVHKYVWDTGNFSLSNRVYSEEVSIPLVNLGKGFAKEITLEWSITNFDELIESINTDYQNSWYKKINVIKIEEEGLIEKIEINYELGGEHYIYSLPEKYLVKDIFNQSITYIPSSGESANIYLPKSFVVLLNLYNSLSFYQTKNLSDLKFPEMNLHVKYMDSNNNKYHDTFNIYIAKLNKNYNSKNSKSETKLRLEARKLNSEV